MAANDGTKAPLPTSPVAVGKDGGGAVPLPLKDILGTNADGPGVTGESTTSDGVLGLSLIGRSRIFAASPDSSIVAMSRGPRSAPSCFP